MFIGRFPQLERPSIGWFLVVGALESLAFASIWELTRVALGTHRWFDLACAQLAGNALSRALPGGAATGGTLEYQMLTSVGFDQATTTTALTATGLLSTGMLFALPVLVVPSLISGLAVTAQLGHGIVLSAVLGVFLFAAGAALLWSDRVVRAVGATLDRIGGALHLTRGSRTSSPARSR